MQGLDLPEKYHHTASRYGRKTPAQDNPNNQQYRLELTGTEQRARNRRNISNAETMHTTPCIKYTAVFDDDEKERMMISRAM